MRSSHKAGKAKFAEFTFRDCMKSSWRSPDGGSSVTQNPKIEPCEAVFSARWGIGSRPIRSFHTVSPRTRVNKGKKKQLSLKSRGLGLRRPPEGTVLYHRVEDNQQLAHATHQSNLPDALIHERRLVPPLRGR